MRFKRYARFLEMRKKGKGKRKRGRGDKVSAFTHARSALTGYRLCCGKEKDKTSNMR